MFLVKWHLTGDPIPIIEASVRRRDPASETCPPSGRGKGTFSELLDKAVYDGGQLRAILFWSLWRRKSAVSKGLCERRTLGAHALNCPPLERPREKVPVHPGLSYAPGPLRTARTA